MQKKFLNIGDCVAIGNAKDGLDSYGARQAYIISLTGQSYDYYDGRVEFKTLEEGSDIFVMAKGKYDPDSDRWHPEKVTAQKIIAPWADYAAHQAVKNAESAKRYATQLEAQNKKQEEWELMLAMLVDLNIDFAPTNKYSIGTVDGLTPSVFIDILKRVKGNAKG